MTDDPTLLATVLAHPGDDAPRLVYADWLDEHGQPDRAEFIRVQIELTRTPVWDVRRPGLERREADLLGEHQIEWAAPLLDAGATNWAFRRGFLEQVLMSVSDFMTHGQVVIDRTTARYLYSGVGDWRALLAHPAARHLRGLILGNRRDGDDIAAALAAAPELSELRWLTVGGGGLTDAGLGKLAEAAHLGRLEHLAVGGHDLTAAGLRALAGATFAGSLRYLELSTLAAAPAGFVELAAGPRWGRLTELVLDGNNLGGPHLPRLVAGARLPALTTLSIKSVGLGEDPAGLAGVLALPRLGRLQLAQDVVAPAVRGLLESPAVGRYAGVVVNEYPDDDRPWTEPGPAGDRLELLINSSRADLGAWLRDAGFVARDATATLCGPGESTESVAGPWPALRGDTVVPIEFERPAGGPVRRVRLTCYVTETNERPAPPPFLPALADPAADGPRLLRRGCDVWEDWPERWRRFLHGPHARRLHLYAERGVRDADLRALLAVPAFARLRDLDLGGTAITLAGVRDLVTAPQAAGLRHLRLSFNELGDDLAEVIAASPMMSKLVSLKLSFCGIGDRGAAALAGSPHLRRLTTLKLWGGRGVRRPTNQIGDAGAIAIANSPTLARLMGLRLRGNDIGDAGAKALAASPYLKWMRDLNIAENPIGPDGTRALEERFGDRLGYCIGEAELLPD